jgi:hypothetical protein
MNHDRLFRSLLTIALLWFGFSPVDAAAPAIGVVSKTILEVTLKPSGKTWAKANKGDALSSGDMIKTGDKSFAIIKFNDNSMVRIRERSELTVTGTLKDKAFSKSVDVDRGVVGFSVKPQQTNEEFRFTSPTSVASIRGTGGMFAAHDTTDTLTVLEGTVHFTNRFSSKSLDIGSGFTGISSRSGLIESHATTRDERRAADDALKTGEQSKQLRLQLKGPRGDSKDLIIDFKE